MSPETGLGRIWDISPQAWELADVATNPQPPTSLEQQHCTSPSKADPAALPLLHTAHGVTVCTSLALCLSFPTLHYTSPGQLRTLMLKLLLNMLKLLHEYSQPSSPNLHSTSPVGGINLLFFCRKANLPVGREETTRPCLHFSQVSSFGRGNVCKPTTQQQTGSGSRPGGCCPLGKNCLFPPGPQGSPGRGRHHGQCCFSDRGPSLRLPGAPQAELSQRLEVACGWRHPGVQGGPRGPAWGWRDNLHRACPRVPYRGTAGTREDQAAGGSASAPRWLQVSPQDGFGGADRPHSQHPTRTGTLPRGMELGSTPSSTCSLGLR